MVIYKKSFAKNIDAAIERVADKICSNADVDYTNEVMLANAELVNALAKLIEVSYPIVNGSLRVGKWDDE